MVKVRNYYKTFKNGMRSFADFKEISCVNEATGKESVESV